MKAPRTLAGAATGMALLLSLALPLPAATPHHAARPAARPTPVAAAIASTLHQGELALKRGKPEQAVAAFRAARKASLAAHQPRLAAVAEYGWGRAAMAADRPGEAIVHLKAAGTAWHALHAAPLERAALELLASAQEAQGLLPESVQSLDLALALARSGKDSRLTARILQRRGELEQTMGQSADSLRDFREATGLYKEAGDTDAVSALWTAIGRTFRQLGDGPAALQAFDEALRLQQGRSDGAGVALLQVEEGQTLLAERQYDAARARLALAEPVLAGHGGAGEAQLLLARGRLAELTGDAVRASQAYTQAAAQAQQDDLPSLQGQALEARGQLLAIQGQMRDGLGQMRAALNLAAAAHDAPRQAALLVSMCQMESVLGEVRDASKDAAAAQKAAVTLHLPVVEENATGELASLQERAGQQSRAAEGYRDAIALARQYNDWSGLWRWTWGLGRTREAAGDFDEALASYRTAIEVQQQIPALRSLPEAYGSYLHERSGPYRSAIDLLVRQGDDASLREAFRLVEQVHAEETSRMFGTQPVAAALPDPQGDAAREEALRFRICSVSEDLRGGVRRATATRMASVLARLSGEEKVARAALAASNPRFNALLAPSVADVQAVQTHLPPQTMLLEFFPLPNAVAVWAVDHDGLHVYHRPVPRKELATRVNTLLAALHSGDDGWKPLAANLYDLLLGDLKDTLSRTESLVIVPAGSLTALPFSVLTPDAGSAPGSCLGQNGTIVYAPSARAWLAAPVPPAEGQVAFVGVDDGQPGNEAEASALAGQSPGARVQTGAAATREAVLADLGGSRVLHLAAPLRDSLEAPVYSSMALGGTDSLSFLDWLGLKRRPAVVCMSATQFPWHSTGPDAPASRLADLMLSGGQTGTVLLAMQTAPDVRRPLLVAFYHFLAQGDRPAEALHHAGKEVAQSHPEPRAWAWMRAFGSL